MPHKYYCKKGNCELWNRDSKECKRPKDATLYIYGQNCGLYRERKEEKGMREYDTKLIQTRKVAIIGSTQYYEKMREHRQELLEDCQVRLPTFDDEPELNELEVSERNLEMIRWADEVHIIWDQRSMGTILDFGMLFALRKRFKIIYMEPKTIPGIMKRYEEKTNE